LQTGISGNESIIFFEGRSPHTAKYKPWKLVAYVAFSNEEKALAFEKYIKSGSGRAFAEKRLWG
jgi:putative endonuclease